MLRVMKWSLVVVGLLPLVCAGCNSQPAGTPSTSEGSSSESGHAHAHPSTGPHQGALIELGNEEYHAELVHEGEWVTVWILDSSGTKTVPIDAADLTINLVHDSEPMQFKLAATPEATDPSGLASKFSLQSSELAEELDHGHAAAKLAVSINGKSYRGEVQHDGDHDHEGHDH